MYSQERELKKLRATVRNKARVEGCIAEANVAPGWLQDYVAYVRQPKGTDERKGLRFVGFAWPTNVR
jgi:hypothetical protein